MIKVYLDNGDIVNCQEDISEILAMIKGTKDAKKVFFGFIKTDNEAVIINADKIIQIEGKIRNESDSEVETGPYSEDIIVD